MWLPMPSNSCAQAISAHRLSKQFRLRKSITASPQSSAARDHWALREVSLSVKPGECVGLIGPNGAGKSTLLKILAGVTAPTSGTASIYGRIGCLLELGAGFHQELTGRQNVFLSGALLGMSRRETSKAFDKIVDFSGTAGYIDQPIKWFSSGMYLRLALSVVVHLQVDVLLLDEALSASDETFRAAGLARIREMANSGTCVLLVSHDRAITSQVCDRSITLAAGRIVSLDG